jgi:fatty-acyl-CoA synthase
MLANTPPMIECHYGVPMTGAVLNTLNTRLDAATIAFALDHAETKVLITDKEFSGTIKEALALASAKPLVIDYDDPEFTGDGERLGDIDYEDFIAAGDPSSPGRCPTTNGTPSRSTTPRAPPATPRASSTTTAAPTCWRQGNVVTCGMPQASGLSVDAADVPLQRLVLPVVDLVANAGTHVCLRQVRAGAIFEAIAEHRVTHYVRRADRHGD